MLYLKSFLIILTLLTFLVIASKGQVIDSVSYKPYPDVDSIEYWHTMEVMENNQQYFTNGYFQYCSCNTRKLFDESKQKRKQKIPISEGFLNAGNKTGTWTYWKNVTAICCNEVLLHPDSTITYDLGKRTKKIDNKATYFFNDKDSIIVNPFYHHQELQYKIVCHKDHCQLFVNDNYIVKEFSKNCLEMELSILLSGGYNFNGRKIIEKTTIQ